MTWMREKGERPVLALRESVQVLQGRIADGARASEEDRRRAEAMAELTGHAGTQFDPEVVQALVGYLFGRRQAGLATV